MDNAESGFILVNCMYVFVCFNSDVRLNYMCVLVYICEIVIGK